MCNLLAICGGFRFFCDLQSASIGVQSCTPDSCVKAVQPLADSFPVQHPKLIRRCSALPLAGSFAWGQINWRKLAWARARIFPELLRYGLDVVWSDVDVVWFKNPTHLLSHFPEASASPLCSSSCMVVHHSPQHIRATSGGCDSIRYFDSSRQCVLCPPVLPSSTRNFADGVCNGRTGLQRSTDWM